MLQSVTLSVGPSTVGASISSGVQVPVVVHLKVVGVDQLSHTGTGQDTVVPGARPIPDME